MTMLIKDIKNLTAEKNPYLYTTLVTVSVTIAISVFKFLIGWEFDPLEALLYGVIFWVIFFLTTKFILRKTKKKKE